MAASDSKVSCHYIRFAAGDRKDPFEYEVMSVLSRVVMPGDNFAGSERKFAHLNIDALHHGFNAFDFVRQAHSDIQQVVLFRPPWRGVEMDIQRDHTGDEFRGCRIVSR